MHTGRAAPDLLQVVADSPLLRTFDRGSLRGLALEWVVLDSAEALPLRREDSDVLYFVASGRVEIVDATGESEPAVAPDAPALTSVVAGDVIGDMRTLMGTRDLAVAALRAVTPTRLVRLIKDQFDDYVAKHPEAGAKLRHAFAPRFYHRELVSVLGDMFGTLSEALLNEVEPRLTWRHLARGEILFRQDDRSDQFFFVIAGRLSELATDDAGQEKVLDLIAQGSTVGETGAFSDEPRTTSVVAVRDSVLLEFSRSGFRELARQHPSLNAWLAGLLTKRLGGLVRAEPHKQLGSNIVLIPVGGSTPIDRFGERFSKCLTQRTSGFLVSSALADQYLDTHKIAQAAEGSPGDLRVRAWLNDRESRSKYVVYLADPGLTNWTRRCIQQADEIVFLGTSPGTPGLNEAEEEVLRLEKVRQTKFRKTLVLLHPACTSDPLGTSNWLRHRGVDRHFHVRAENERDLERLVRYFLRCEIGLVLSGGGSRGFAHVGVLKAIQELQLPIDFIGGVSMGSLIAGVYASASDLDGQVALFKKLLRGVFRDYTLPFVSLTRGRRFNRCLQGMLGDRKIEDLWIPYFCLSSNLTRADTVIHASGLLWEAVRASSSLPGLVPPVIVDGDLLYDGCLLNSLPIDVMRKEIQNGQLIAVDVVPSVDLNIRTPTQQIPSGWRLSWNRLNPLTRPIELPSIVDILQRAGAFGSAFYRQQLIDRNLADLYLRPPADDFNILDFSVADEAIETGYTYGEAMIRRWMEENKLS